jgi:hypothetical protein
MWNENGTEILKIIGEHPKVNKSGLKRSAGAVNSSKIEMPRVDYRQ